MEAAELAKMSQYDHFVVQLEVPDGIREGYRSFIAACDGAYYDGSSYSAAKAMYDNCPRISLAPHPFPQFPELVLERLVMRREIHAQGDVLDDSGNVPEQVECDRKADENDEDRCFKAHSSFPPPSSLFTK